jgi:putative tryptophan/tyrosine transport system substrate-binding protein
MRRREFIALLSASVTWPFAALAQEPGRTYRLGTLWGGQRVDDSINVSLRSAFLDPARRAGFIEGQNLTVDDRAASNRSPRRQCR